MLKISKALRFSARHEEHKHMDLYAAQQMSKIKIDHFHQEAEHQRLVREARHDDENKPRHRAMMSLIALMVLVSRIGGSSLS